MPVVLLPCRTRGQHMTATWGYVSSEHGDQPRKHATCPRRNCMMLRHVEPFLNSRTTVGDISFSSPIFHLKKLDVFSFASSSSMKLSFRVYEDLSQWPEGVISTRLLWLEWPTSR